MLSVSFRISVLPRTVCYIGNIFIAVDRLTVTYLCCLLSEIFDAIHRRNYRVISDQLMKVSKYRHKGALVEETRRIFALRNQLRRLLVFPQYIPELRHAGDELIYMNDPPPEVHITMGALFLLLEEPDRAIEVS